MSWHLVSAIFHFEKCLNGKFFDKIKRQMLKNFYSSLLQQNKLERFDLASFYSG